MILVFAVCVCGRKRLPENPLNSQSPIISFNSQSNENSNENNQIKINFDLPSYEQAIKMKPIELKLDSSQITTSSTA